jgi:hypothetical protein
MRPPWARRTSLPHTTVGFREGRHGATLTSANPAATSADATRARPPEANLKLVYTRKAGGPPGLTVIEWAVSLLVAGTGERWGGPAAAPLA